MGSRHGPLCRVARRREPPHKARVPPYITPAAALVGLTALYAYASWRAARPADPLKPRLLPWRTLSFTVGVGAFLALLLTLAALGVHT